MNSILMSENNEIKRVKLEEIQSLLKVKQEKINSEQTITNEQLKIKQELIEQLKVKQESTNNIRINNEIEKSKEIQLNPQTQDEVSRTIIPKRIPNPNNRPKRPKKNVLSLAKIASIDTQDLFIYNNTLNSFPDKLISPTKEMINTGPHFDTEIDRNPYQSTYYRNKKRQNIDTLITKYDLGIEILNEDGTIESNDFFNGNNMISPKDTDLEVLLTSPKRIRSDKNTTEKSEIDEITRKYDFIQKDTSLLECDEIIVNRSISNEYSVRIKCERNVYSFQMKQDTPFSETIEKLAKKLEISPKQILLTHQDETIIPTDNLSILNLDENAILDAITLSTGFISPVKTHEPKIKIKIQFAKNLGGQVQIMAPLTADLKGILTQICESKELTPSKFRLQFDGDPMELSQSLQDYGLEDGDLIDAIMVT